MSDADSNTELDEIHTTVWEWFDAFAGSPASAVLTESQRREAGAIVDFFTEYSYNHLGVAPVNWTCDTVCECCTKVLPRKVSAELAFFEAIAPVLGAFFRFLDAESLHPKGIDLAETAEAVAVEISRAAAAVENRGPAKRFVMKGFSEA